MNRLALRIVKQQAKSLNRLLTARMASTYLIQEPKYAFLKELGLAERNLGVFGKHGQWRGNGDVIDSVCPANNRPIAAIAQGSLADYEHCVAESMAAWNVWADVRFSCCSGSAISWELKLNRQYSIRFRSILNVTNYRNTKTKRK